MPVTDRGISIGSESASANVVAVPAARGLAYDYYVVVILAIVCMLSFLDRTLISMLIQPIKSEFALTDTQIGILIGFGFVIFYSVLGVPLGAIADRSNRRNLLLFGLIAWSLATISSGLAGGFAMLMAMRALVGVGEATLSPCAYSTIADRFLPARLGSAIAIYAAGVSIGGGLAMIFGGLLADWTKTVSVTLPLVGQLSGWRLSLILVGLLGFPLALLMWLTIEEAPRKVKSNSPPMSEVWKYMVDRPRAIFGFIMVSSIGGISNYIVFLWAPAFFMRVHGLDARTAGLMIGTIVAVFGTIGMLSGGFIADRLAKNGAIDGSLTVSLWALLVQVVTLPIAFLASDVNVAMAFLIPTIAMATASASVGPTALQLMTPPLMRGRVIAIWICFVNVIGIGIAPLLIGILSDHLFTDTGGLGPSMTLVGTAAVAVASVTLILIRSSARTTMTELSSSIAS